MAEQYVEAMIDVVIRETARRGVNELLFWEWLGNAKFKEDKGNLTQERASQIRREVQTLLDEYCALGGQPKERG